MPKYQVRITETAVYSLTVEADSEDDAREQALEEFTQADDINQYFDNVSNREADVLGTTEA